MIFAVVAAMAAGTMTVGPRGAASASSESGAAAPAAAPAQVDAPVPKIAWKACEEGLDCAKVRVPLDYDDPGGRTAELALAKHPAGSPDARIGTLFVNPGGPGDSAVDSVPWYVDNLPAAVLERFDVVGIDPRGVGGSTPLRCRVDQDAAEAPSVEFPLTRRQEQAQLRYDDHVRRSCATGANPIIDHMTTADTARDMDLIRQAVGDERLTYYGISYGSYLGATYAAMFPDRIRALVVDGVMDPVGYATGHTEDDARKPVTQRWGSGRGSWEALTAAFAECDRVGRQRCPIAGRSTAKWRRIVGRLERGPVKVDGTVLRYQDVVITAAGSVRGVATYLPLMRFIEATYDAMFGDPGQRRQADAGAAFARLREQPGGGPESAGKGGGTSVAPVIQGVVCSDSVNPAHPRAWVKAAGSADAEAPWFGRLWSWRSSLCAQWPGTSDDAYRGPFRTETSAPVFLIAHLHDPATPISGARTLNTLLEGSRMLTLDGWGHGALGESACVASKAEDYLVSGTLPPPGTVCRQDDQPFPPAD